MELLAHHDPKHNRNGRRRSARRHFDHGVRLAALRGITGGRLCVHSGMTVKEAALASGSCVPYVTAAVTLLQGDNVTLINEALTGRVGLLEAARRANGHVNGNGKRGGETLAQHILRSPLAERIEAARIVGTQLIWDSMIVPVCEEDRAPAE